MAVFWYGQLVIGYNKIYYMLVCRQTNTENDRGLLRISSYCSKYIASNYLRYGLKGKEAYFVCLSFGRKAKREREKARESC
jgi:hypothetical protein